MTPTTSHGVTGETLAIPHRIVVAPSVGRFHRIDTLAVGQHVEIGTPIGLLECPGCSVPVESRFRGRIERILAGPGEHVRAGQAIAWLHST